MQGLPGPPSGEAEEAVETRCPELLPSLLNYLPRNGEPQIHMLLRGRPSGDKGHPYQLDRERRPCKRRISLMVRLFSELLVSGPSALGSVAAWPSAPAVSGEAHLPHLGFYHC